MQENPEQVNLENWSQVQGWMKACCSAVGVEYKHITDRCRKMPYIEYRQLLWLILRENTGASYNVIGLMFRRDHSTIIVGITHIKEILSYDSETQKVYDEFKRQYTIIFQ